MPWKEEMPRALKRSADLIHQDLNYPKLKKVIGLINKLDHVKEMKRGSKTINADTYAS